MKKHRAKSEDEIILNGFIIGMGLIIFYLTFVSPLIHELMQ